MDGPELRSKQDAAAAQIVAELEGALLEYVEKFGPTERARRALRVSALWHAYPKVDQTTKGQR